jgi:hypothetical protein
VTSNLPTVINGASGRCVRVVYAPTYNTNNTNSLIVYWNTSNTITISLTGTIPTQTPTFTPTSTHTNTPTHTPTPTNTPSPTPT